MPNSSYYYAAFTLDSAGLVNYSMYVNTTPNIWPTVFLTSSTKIISGDGTINKPYRLQIVS